MPQQQWETAWSSYSTPMHYPLAPGQPSPESAVPRTEQPPVETTRHEPQQPVVQPPKPPDAELQPPSSQIQVNGDLNGSASQEKQKPHMNGNTHGAQLPEEFNFLKVCDCNLGRWTRLDPRLSSSFWNPTGLSCNLRTCSAKSKYLTAPNGHRWMPLTRLSAQLTLVVPYWTRSGNPNRFRKFKFHRL